MFSDSDGEVREPRILRMRRSPFFGVTAEEGLHLNATDSSTTVLSQNNILEVNDALASDEDLNFAVCLTLVIETDTLGDGGTLTGCEGPGATANRGTIVTVAGRQGRDIASCVVSRETGIGVGREISVQFSHSVCTPHETSREAAVVTGSTRATDGAFVTITSVCYGLISIGQHQFSMDGLTDTRHFATLVPLEALLKEGGITKGDFLGGSQVDVGWTRTVE